MSLAIVEAQKQRPAAGCAGVLFLHLLDWNRSLAKKKKKKRKKQQFSMRTVLPPLLKRTSKNPSPLSSPLHPSTSSEKREESITTETIKTNAMVQPSLVARLMGLESMPVPSHEKPESSQKQSDSLKQDGNARPQKVQKTSNGSGSFITSSNPTLLKGHDQNQKMVSFSPSRSPSRSPRARLVQAAAKILEPGLRPRFSPSPLRYLEEEITVSSSAETEFSGFPFLKSETKEPLINLEKESMKTSKTEAELSNNNARLERKTKKMENSKELIKVNNSAKRAHNLVEKRPSIQKSARKQSIVTNGSSFTQVAKGRTVLCRKKISNKYTHMEPNYKFEKFKTDKRKGRTEVNVINHNCVAVKDRTEKNRAHSDKARKKSNVISAKEKTGDDLSRMLTCSILEKLVSEINEEEGNIYQKACLKGEIDQPSPISILESSFSNDSFSFDSPNNFSDGKLFFLDSTESLNQVDKFDIGFMCSRLNYDSEIASNFELLFSNIFSQEMKYSVNGFLLELLEAVLDASSGDLNGEKEGYRLTNFMFDCIVECLDLKYRFLYKSGYKIWNSVSRFLGKDCMVKKICKEIKEWNETKGRSLDFLAEKDFRNSNFEWRNIGFEGFEIGAEIERDLIGSLVDEFVFDLC